MKTLKIIFTVSYLTLLSGSTLSGQDKLQIYLFPGQGSDHRLFDSLKWSTGIDTTILHYGTPEEDMSLTDFAHSLIPQIDTTNTFALVGVSLGGMICVELSELLNPEFTIIISSAKNSRELPFRYNFQKIVPIYNFFPGYLLTVGARIMQPIVEPDRRNNKDTFKSMLKRKKPLYMKRTVEMIINWDRTQNDTKIYQIHGDNDHTIPIKNIEPPFYLVENGSHMMTLTRADEVSEIVNDIILTRVNDKNK